ncbi:MULTISPECIES: hypothetical protein [Streptomyces]|uniref:Uncharacterized protein n=1 Tax=Streptomyces katrae TaxID=68223 RepID=A0ABT7GUH1_9ACTN|nr:MULTISPECIES: hypothetical protein [Streptomyces]MDK9497273.1 hypothetical protein [Streptomyces katrae]GLX21381.1 hypothetical protein Slala01_50250 [Streptomyces lavendulae subsp. lavendulae]GLX27899.1 hypothetical protein Slala02_37190 [Streptomyces lavendulae subsp. lavendulae]
MKDARCRTLLRGSAAGYAAGLAVAVLSALALGTAAVDAGTEGRTVQAEQVRIDWPVQGKRDVRAQSAPAAVLDIIDWP